MAEGIISNGNASVHITSSLLLQLQSVFQSKGGLLGAFNPLESFLCTFVGTQGLPCPSPTATAPHLAYLSLKGHDQIRSSLPLSRALQGLAHSSRSNTYSRADRCARVSRSRISSTETTFYRSYGKFAPKSGNTT